MIFFGGDGQQLSATGIEPECDGYTCRKAYGIATLTAERIAQKASLESDRMAICNLDISRGSNAKK
ncbi:hypothetical protein [Nostoc sp. CCY0012]|uniref:hypothetical protein n=1 Tax=Nostoc sp. CCY0012 TaxID=1056123 RepID=UPI0039C5FC0D